ncbi:MAG TPA: excinuclease ABC subunit B, partial [Bacteroides sp.]|nr:excinuclease ABC subunit B [Bacteroides sp.]
MEFKLISDYHPTGDQPEAIQQLVEGFRAGDRFQTLLGVTGSGKTFTVANVIREINLPVLVLSHNKTLAAQLYSEFRQFFPENAVEYFVSYYDYYQPEAYLPVTDTYIEKDLSINDEIEKLRLSTTSSLLSGRRDVIVVSSVSCLYGIGNPDDFHNSTVRIKKGDTLSRNVFLRKLVDSLYSRNEIDFKPGTFRVRGDTIDIHLAYADLGYRVEFWGDEIETLRTIHPVSGNTIEEMNEMVIFPANIFITSKKRIKQAIEEIQDDLVKQIDFFRSQQKLIEAQRIEERVNY